MDLRKLSEIQVRKWLRKFGYNMQNETNPVYEDRSLSPHACSDFFLEI